MKPILLLSRDGQKLADAEIIDSGQYVEFVAFSGRYFSLVDEMGEEGPVRKYREVSCYIAIETVE